MSEVAVKTKKKQPPLPAPKEEMLDNGKIKTTIYWESNLHEDIKKLADLDERSTSKFIEMEMRKLRDAAIAAGKIS